jgi:hypothetical protein
MPTQLVAHAYSGQSMAGSAPMGAVQSAKQAMAEIRIQQTIFCIVECARRTGCAHSRRFALACTQAAALGRVRR